MAQQEEVAGERVLWILLQQIGCLGGGLPWCRLDEHHVVHVGVGRRCGGPRLALDVGARDRAHEQQESEETHLGGDSYQ